MSDDLVLQFSDLLKGNITPVSTTVISDTDPRAMQAAIAATKAADQLGLSNQIVDTNGPMGHFTHADDLTPTNINVVAPFETTQAEALIGIDNFAENLRLQLITPGAGQAMVYMGKNDEATRFLARYSTQEESIEAVPAEWPFISSGVGNSGDTMFIVANSYARIAAFWIKFASSLETVRLKAKNAVSAATTVEELTAIVAAVAWPSVS